MRVPIVCLAAGLGTCAVFSVTGCFNAPDQRLPVIEAALREKAKAWNNDSEIKDTCIKGDVTEDADGGKTKVSMTIPASSVPAPFTYCVIDTKKSYFKFYEPEISGNRAVLATDFYCGADDACGTGEYLTLARNRSGWKVIGRQSAWMF